MKEYTIINTLSLLRGAQVDFKGRRQTLKPPEQILVTLLQEFVELRLCLLHLLNICKIRGLKSDFILRRCDRNKGVRL